MNAKYIPGINSNTSYAIRNPICYISQSTPLDVYTPYKFPDSEKYLVFQ